MASLANKILSIAYQGDASVYVVVRDLATGYAWNGTAMESFDASHLATYAIALSDEGGDLFSAALPDGLPAGTYQFYFYEQAAADPAGTDLILSSPIYGWTGSVATDPNPGDLPTPGPYALTTLAAVKQYMGLTSTAYDAKLCDLIDEITDTIEKLCNRRFAAREYRERLDGAHQLKLTLRNFPVQNVSSVTYGNNIAVTLNYTGSAIRATAATFTDPESIDAGGVVLRTVGTDGVSTQTSLAFSAYPTTALLVDKINTIAGWRATLNINIETAELLPTVLNDCMKIVQYLTYPDVAIYNYSLNSRSGVLMFNDRTMGPLLIGDGWGRGRPMIPFPKGHQMLTVKYRAGYETIPPALANICNEAVKNAFNRSTKDTNRRSRTVGPYSETFDYAAIAEQLTAAIRPWMNSEGTIGGAL